MRKIRLREYNSDYPLVVRRRTQTQEKVYIPGDIFPVQEFDPSNRRERLMIVHGRLTQNFNGPTLKDLQADEERLAGEQPKKRSYPKKRKKRTPKAPDPTIQKELDVLFSDAED